jgi:hypothetical protein
MPIAIFLIRPPLARVCLSLGQRQRGPNGQIPVEAAKISLNLRWPMIFRLQDLVLRRNRRLVRLFDPRETDISGAWLGDKLKRLRSAHSSKFGGGYLLMPEPREIVMGGEMLIGYSDRRSDAFSK